MDNLTHEDWKRIAAEFQKAMPGSQNWFAIADAVLTYLLQDRIAATAPVTNGEHQ